MKYQSLCELYNRIELTSKRLEKTALMSSFLRTVKEEEIASITQLLLGKLFAQWDTQVLGLSEKLIIKALGIASGASEHTILDEWRKIGDLGLVAAYLLEKKSQVTLFREELEVQTVISTLQKASLASGQGSTDQKVGAVTKLLSSASALEARYIMRTVIEDLRIGVAQGTLRDALAWAFLLTDEDINYDNTLKSITPVDRTKYNQVISTIQSALDRCNDFGLVALTAKKEGLGGLEKITLSPGKPVKVMLAQKAPSMSEGLKKLGIPCIAEYKYDGFRLLISKAAQKPIQLYTRKLENVTKQFPDIVAGLERGIRATSYILDGEAVGFDPKQKKFLPFQAISQRIRRKHDIARLVKELPIALHLFDVLFVDGEELMDTAFEQRRTTLERITKTVPLSLSLAEQRIIHSEHELQEFYNKSLSAGNEGVMLKKPDSPYQPGSRVGTMMKIKPSLDTLDLVIVGAEWGTGKRSGWLTSFTLACADDDAWLPIGKFGTGIKEKTEAKGEEGVTFEEMTTILKPHIIHTEGREVTIQPSIVVEVRFEEVQVSPTYQSGFALRFPRLVRLRDDKEVSDATSLADVKVLFSAQRQQT